MSPKILLLTGPKIDERLVWLVTNKCIVKITQRKRKVRSMKTW